MKYKTKMPNYIYLEKNTITKAIIGNLLFIPSILALIILNKENNPILILFYLFAAYWGIFFISTEGLEIDFKNKRFRKLYSIYGLKIPLSWNYFPEIKYIALVATSVKQTFGGRTFRATATTTITEKTIKINIFDVNEKYFTLYFANDQNEALKIAEEIKEFYKIEIIKNF